MRIIILASALVLTGCSPNWSAWQSMMGADDILIIRTPPGEPPIIIVKEREYEA